MKKNITLLLIMLFTINTTFAMGYKMNTPVEGKSIANDAMQFDIMQKIYKRMSKEYPTCFDYSIYDTQIIHNPYDVKKKKNKYVSGYWKELWTVNCCNKKKQIPITFYITKNKTIYSFDKY